MVNYAHVGAPRVTSCADNHATTRAHRLDYHPRAVINKRWPGSTFVRLSPMDDGQMLD